MKVSCEYSHQQPTLASCPARCFEFTLISTLLETVTLVFSIPPPALHRATAPVNKRVRTTNRIVIVDIQVAVIELGLWSPGNVRFALVLDNTTVMRRNRRNRSSNGSEDQKFPTLSLPSTSCDIQKSSFREVRVVLVPVVQIGRQ